MNCYISAGQQTREDFISFFLPSFKENPNRVLVRHFLNISLVTTKVHFTLQRKTKQKFTSTNHLSFSFEKPRLNVSFLHSCPFSWKTRQNYQLLEIKNGKKDCKSNFSSSGSHLFSHKYFNPPFTTSSGAFSQINKYLAL